MTVADVPAVHAITFAGHVITQGVTVTVNEQHVPVLLDASFDVQVTVVVPTLKLEPDAGVHVTVAPEQLSETVGEVYVTTVGELPLTMILVGQAPMVGDCVSLTVTVNVHAEPVLLDASFGVQVTVVVPTLKLEPDAGTHVTVAPVQLSEAVGVV